MISNCDANNLLYFIIVIALIVIFVALVVYALKKNHIASALTMFIGMLGYIIYSAFGQPCQLAGKTTIKINAPPFYFSFDNITTIPSPHTADYIVFPILLTLLIICCLFKLPGK